MTKPAKRVSSKETTLNLEHQPAASAHGQKDLSSAALVTTAHSALIHKKAQHIAFIDMPRGAMAEKLVIATGTSERHVQTLAEQVVDAFEKAGISVLGVEGVPYNHWVLVDAGDVVVHVFTKETRHLYNLEKLWAHGFEEEGDQPPQKDLTGS